METRKYKKETIDIIVLVLIFALLFFFVFIFAPSIAYAQDPGFDHTARFEDRWRKDGNLVTVQITKDNPVRIFVLGREEAKIDLSKLKITVRRLKPYPGKVLKINHLNNYYVVADKLDFKQATDLEVTTHLNNQKETFNFQLEQKVEDAIK